MSETHEEARNWAVKLFCSGPPKKTRFDSGRFSISASCRITASPLPYKFQSCEIWSALWYKSFEPGGTNIVSGASVSYILWSGPCGRSMGLERPEFFYFFLAVLWLGPKGYIGTVTNYPAKLTFHCLLSSFSSMITSCPFSATLSRQTHRSSSTVIASLKCFNVSLSILNRLMLLVFKYKVVSFPCPSRSTLAVMRPRWYGVKSSSTVIPPLLPVPEGLITVNVK